MSKGKEPRKVKKMMEKSVLHRGEMKKKMGEKVSPVEKMVMKKKGCM